tara:strand:- start:492 stop:743 length:252 start_codon:yes stop_codon:yes gene_type:complete
LSYQLFSYNFDYYHINSHETSANKKLSDIEDLVKRKVILYDHKVNSTEFKFAKEFELKNLSLDELPDYIKRNTNKFKDWIDLN